MEEKLKFVKSRFCERHFYVEDRYERPSAFNHTTLYEKRVWELFSPLPTPKRATEEAQTKIPATQLLLAARSFALITACFRDCLERSQVEALILSQPWGWMKVGQMYGNSLLINYFSERANSILKLRRNFHLQLPPLLTLIISFRFRPFVCRSLLNLLVHHPIFHKPTLSSPFHAFIASVRQEKVNKWDT